MPPRQFALVADGTCGYPANGYYDFEYRLSKTANWTKTPLRRVVYRALSLLSRRRVDSLAVPALLEWPQHLFIIMAAAVLVGLHLGRGALAVAGWTYVSTGRDACLTLPGWRARNGRLTNLNSRRVRRPVAAGRADIEAAAALGWRR